MRPSRLLVAVAMCASAFAISATAPDGDVVRAESTGQATRYVAFSPIRVLDTREGGADPLRSRASMSIQPLTPAVLAAAGADPLDIEAVAINLTIVDPVLPGWLKTFPTSQPAPDIFSASAVNNQFANENIANFSIVPVGANGRISIQSLSGSDVVVDVQGVFTRSTGSKAGRFIPLATPRRALDTRPTGPIPAKKNIVLDLAGTVGIPPNASAAVINVVAADTRQPGFLTMWPENETRPDPASNINYPGGFYNIAGSAITRLSNGKLRIYAHGTTDVVVDVVGYMTGDSDANGTRGLFVPVEPERHYDSRSNEPPFGTTQLRARTARTIGIAGKFSVPATGVEAVASNITMTETAGPGFLAVYPKNPRPDPYSTVNNVFVRHSIANHAIVELDSGSLTIYTHNTADAIVDITGYFLDGTVTPPERARRTNTSTAPTPDVNPGEILSPPFDDDFAFLQEAGSQDEAQVAPYERNGRRYFGWNPCDPITYAVNAGRANQEQINALNVAIRQVEEASGFDFVYLGNANGSLDENGVDPRVPGKGSAMAVFGFSDPYATPALAGGTIGIGGLGRGIDNQTAIEQKAGAPFAYIVRDGFAIADITDVTETDELISTFTHEIGHMVGLNHVGVDSAGRLNGQALDELMLPVLTSQTTFGNGDKTGLYRLGEPNCPGGATLQLDVATADGSQNSAPAAFDVVRWVAD